MKRNLRVLRSSSVVLLAVLAGACQSSAPIDAISDDRLRELIAATFEAHGSYQDLREAGALSFVVAASGPIGEALGPIWRAHVELSPYPRSRWMLPHGMLDCDRHGQVTISPRDLGDRLPADVNPLLHATALFLAMPMPLVQSTGAPTYTGRRRTDNESWDVLTLQPRLQGWADAQALSVFVNRSSHRVDRAFLTLGGGQTYWLIATGVTHAHRLAIADEVRWFATDQSGLPGELLATLELNEVFAQPAERAFVPVGGAPAGE